MDVLERHQLGQVQSYTVGQLNQDTAGVIRAINAAGTPALITRHGRIVALITPLEGVKVESLVLSRDTEYTRSLLVDDGSALTREEVAAELGIEPPMA